MAQLSLFGFEEPKEEPKKEERPKITSDPSRYEKRGNVTIVHPPKGGYDFSKFKKDPEPEPFPEEAPSATPAPVKLTFPEMVEKTNESFRESIASVYLNPEPEPEEEVFEIRPGDDLALPRSYKPWDAPPIYDSFMVMYDMYYRWMLRTNMRPAEGPLVDTLQDWYRAIPSEDLPKLSLPINPLTQKLNAHS